MIIVAGAGAFGTALAVSLARNGSVGLWARDADHVRQMREMRENRARLPGVTLGPEIELLEELPQIVQDQPVLLAVPMQRLAGFLDEYGRRLNQGHLVACCKGVELTTGRSPTQIISQIVPDALPAILTGPSFAKDIAAGLPTALTLACADADAGQHLQQRLTTPNLRLYRTTDVIGAELGGALKNVIAIACGAVIGARLGDSARAALMTRGFAEMTRMAAALGAQPETLSGLSGFGDLVLTASSELSRNYCFGLSIGRGEVYDPSITVEGAATAQAALEKATGLGIEMPVTQAVTALVKGELQVDAAMDMLLSRPLKEETC